VFVTPMRISARGDLMHDLSQAHLLALARGGDPLAGPLLISALGGRLLGYAHIYAPDLADSAREEIVEQAIEAGLRTIERFDPDRGTLYSWFRRQVRYRAGDWRRRNPLVADFPVEFAQKAPDFDQLDVAVSTHLAAAIATLKDEERLLLQLRGVEELDHAEIGRRLGIAESTARQRFKRAKDQLALAMRADEVLRPLLNEPTHGKGNP
jgi:RNA polymerase sigma factor (sigma-70 family)